MNMDSTDQQYTKNEKNGIIVKEGDNWENIRKIFGWDMTYSEKNNYHINQFDDGNEKYEQYENEWMIYGRWKGKVALINIYNRDIRIGSISKWKLNVIQYKF
jgi:hypothetical protein